MLARMRCAPRLRTSRRGVLLTAALAFGSVVAGCRGTPLAAPTAGDPRPPRRASGPRLPAPFHGADPNAAGLVRVQELLWIRAEDAALWQRGGAGVVPVPGSPPGEGLTLRTDHVLVATDLTAPQALPI